MSSSIEAYFHEVSMKGIVNCAAEDDVRQVSHPMWLLGEQAECAATTLDTDTAEGDLAKVAFGRGRGLDIVKLVTIATEGVARWRAIVQVKCILGIDNGVLDRNWAAPPIGVPCETCRTWTSKVVVRRFEIGLWGGRSGRGQLRAM